MPAYPKDQEDFKSRYQTETAGMPSYLATAAANNLATQDAAMSRVNAVARLVPQPSSPVPFTGLDESAVASREGGPTSISDLHSDDISQRRAAIDEQKRQIQARLGIIKPADAGLAAVVLAGPHERKDLLGNLAVLEHESDNLLREHQINSVAAARAAHENFVREKHIDTATEFSNMMSHLQDVRKTTKRGTPEREEALLNAAVKFPAAFSSGAGQTIFKQMSQEHDAAAALEDRSYWQRFGQAFKEASQIAKKRGIDVQYDEQGFPSTGLTANIETDTAPPERKLPAIYVKQAAALAEAKTKKDAAYNANKSADLTPHDRNIALEQAKLDAMKEALGINDSPAAAPSAAAAPTATEYAPEGMTWMVDPRGDRWMTNNKYVEDNKKRGWSLAPQKSASSTPTPSATPAPSAAPAPDLKALAQKALNDPNASEAHKAAARKILGQ